MTNKTKAIFLIGIFVAIILAGIYGCVSHQETKAYIESVDAFIQEVEH